MNEKKAEKGAKVNKKQVDAVPSNITPNANLKCEVVVPPLPEKISESPSSHDAQSSAESDKEDVPRAQRRKAAKAVIVISDESNDDESDSNYGDTKMSHATSGYSEESPLSEDEMSVDASSEDEKSRKTKNARKPIPAKKGSKLSTAGDRGGKKRKSEVMWSDDETDESNPKKKMKKETKPKVSRIKADPWKLKSTAVQKDWKKLQAPPLEMFHFHRLVIDEYTYLDGKTHSLITNLQATCRWVLSGTPPVHDFPSLKTIAVFLDIHLGIDDDGEGQSVQVKKRKREQTGK